ncbi:MAG: hypothetical protein NWE91_02700 [Candidatus Bathyarchaeota archaeon]|nr:hypothetical protein [Candidatus Bathyarchaeota archaeon]
MHAHELRLHKSQNLASLNNLNMKTAVESGNVTAFSSKIVALALIMFFGGVASGIILLQSFNGGSSSDAQEETLELSNQHVWGNQSGWIEAAIVVLNTGERDAIIRKITIRGIECDWSDVYYWKTDTGPISNELEPTPVELSSSSFNIVIDGIQRTFQQATGELTLRSAWTVVLYVKSPFNLTSSDGGTKVIITIFTENNLYYEEAYVEVTFTFMQTEELSFTSYTWGTNNAYCLIQIKNTGSSDLSISEVRVNDVACADDGITTPHTLEPGSTVTLTVTRTGGYTSGVKYEFKVVTAKGNTFGPYIRTAP